MKISDLMKMGLRNLGRRKARTALTVVGIVIGTISIVVMISIGIGMNQSFRENLMQYGSFTVINMEKEQADFDENGNYSGEKKQKLDDKLIAKLKQIPNVKTVSPMIELSVKLKSGNYESNSFIKVMDADSFEDLEFPKLKDNKTYQRGHNKNKIKIWAGNEMLSRFYNPNSSNYQSKAITPGKDRVVMMIYDEETLPRDDKGVIKIQLKEYATELAVFDTAEYNEYSYNMYMDKVQFINIYKDYVKQLPPDKKRKAEKKLKEYEGIKINADNVEDVKNIQEAIKEMGYKSSSMSDYTKQIENFSKTIQMVLGGVGAISMLVAAISIANTMIMSIYERTKEIGVMKVLGCHIGDIKKLFLFEAAMMGLIGGVIGITCSYVASYLLNTFGGALGNALNMFGGGEEGSKLSVIPIWLPFVAASFAIVIGIISGYYPASRATKISAIEAMKNE
nr:FtsX-like permease family protein [uncultured Catonella sp.]